ncbi:hypothetical protein A1Q2_00342 [Trichosporon asahii var. asahii CBS 8904]|uniref:YDG domain-containing protein n=1 Tax=Trichosporon asahii var. asahii (strain CBS 8904) TaxID=1220162 RepID=K1W980_TRIAC|nr:hypothetical protein A1Q2_00342 [Trichosporon asahii var. asahii CBS 8904]
MLSTADDRENEDLLKSLGLAPLKKAPPPPPKPNAAKTKKKGTVDDDDYSASPERELRRSGRARKLVQRDDSSSEDDYEPTPYLKRVMKSERHISTRQRIDQLQRIQQRLGERLHDPKTFGPIPGVEVGTWWPSRMECSTASIHAPTVAGISGNATEGAWSVALSGGYPDDVDLGEAFTYTGSGGRDLKGTKQNPKNLRTAPQTFDQSFDNFNNAALKVSSRTQVDMLTEQRSAETRKPVRVIRGFKLDSKYAPATGYRYDGLYVVEKAYMTRGLTKGFLVCKYAFKRLPGQPPLPIREDDGGNADEGEEVEDEEIVRPEDEDVGDEFDGGEEDNGQASEEVGNDHGREGQARGKRKRQRDQDSDEIDDEEATADGDGEELRAEGDMDNADEHTGEQESDAEEDESVAKRGRGRPRKHLIQSPPRRRGPGRPRKNPLPAAEGEPPTKRGPGRPRKYPLPEALTEKRGRGRTRTNLQPKDTTAAAEEDESEPPVSKRVRGRPRQESLSNAPGEEPREAAEPIPARRGRGWPRKGGVSDSPVPTESELETPARRGRGRPRKSDPTPAAESVMIEPEPTRRSSTRFCKSGASDGLATTAPDATEVTPAKPAPGRPRKHNPGGSTSVNVEEPEEAPVKRRPGRPRKSTITTPKLTLPRRTSGRLSTHSTRTESEAAEVDKLLTPAELRRSTRRVSTPQTPIGSPLVSKATGQINTPATPLQTTRVTRRLRAHSATPGSSKPRRIMEVVIPTPSPAREQ